MVILVSSCDEYSDTWEPFFTLFSKFWSTCNYPIFLSSVTIPFKYPNIHNLLLGNRLGWGDGLIKAISQIKEYCSAKYILLLLDDYFLCDYVVNDNITRSLNLLKKTEGNYLRLIPKPPPESPIKEDPHIGLIPPDTPYRVSLQASIWSTDTLFHLLSPTDTPWDMEILGTKRAVRLPGFYCSFDPFLSYVNGIERGIWTPEAIQLFNISGIDIGNSRKILVDRGNINSSSFRSKLIKSIPTKYRFAVRRIYSMFLKKHNT